MPYLLDTSLCVALLRREAVALAWASRHTPADVSVSAITEMELLLGIQRCERPHEERLKVEMLLRGIRVLPWDSAAARVTAEIYDLLVRRGGVLEAADLFIAGHALSLGCTLVTSDNHFLRNATALGLKIEDWRAATE